MTLTVRLAPELETRLEQEAQRLGISKSAFVKDALERVLGLKNPAQLLQQVRSGTPVGASDLSVHRFNNGSRLSCVKSILLDAGPQIALFAVDDVYHGHYDTLVSDGSVEGLRLLTTWPCVVEACYLLGLPQRYELLRWIELGGVSVYPFEARHLTDMVDWMERYSEPGKREMDLADASLCWLATETGIREIMTVDVRDFSRYRLPDQSAFVIV